MAVNYHDRKDINMNHCCELMAAFLNDQRIPIKYCPCFREYYMPLIGSGAVQCIDYCPWCGSLLPTSLRDEYCEILETEYGIDPFPRDESKDFPEEFKTDEWWKKRNL